ncbi:type VI secretion system membrane subunit TssM [Sphingomonas immobilis]|uniref:Type VI secretion system membrane subunit TssM n=1 Tax=Sphingomonas immobilis TaxID=3063997 RepID=A0ABT9A1V7_9SPHN|nr:type VI secretion system membrane subunit TssM [Sphingomonas sp. CA1-15]MDO7843818.1 type VI secretion system membrane subunit TssM [Sphingomonas sp. CA1-15]
MKFFKSWWFITILCCVLLSLVFAVGLPFLVAFFNPWYIRALCVLVIFGVWGIFAFLRVRKAKKAAAALAAELAGPNAADEEGKALAKRMQDALGQLKTGAGKKRDYLYTRPWYVIIGPPGAGKTTALLNSGLRFPFADNAVKGVGGTRNLDFWFADEAVMIDTAGRYTTQDSDYQVDSKGWTSFLGLLKKHRPLQPVNGIIVAIGVDELIASDVERIDSHARAVRRRLVELRKELEVSAPVYVMLTKADLLAGFIEYFDDLDVEGRRSVLGSTCDYKSGRPNGEVLARAFDEMAQAVADRQAKRVFEEVDPLRRSLLLGFPSQVQSLRARLMRFVEGAMVSGDEQVGTMRGFYLTSGVQEGAPLDRIMSGMADVFDRPAQVRSGQGGSGRAYFLNRLLTEVMFPEAGLVTMDPRARARQRTQLVGALAGVAAVVVITLALWTMSFFANRAFQQDLIVKTQAAQVALKDAGIDLKQVREGDPDLRAALPALQLLRNLPRGYADRQNGGPPLSMTFGLYQSSLSQQAEETYREALRRIFLPRLMIRLEQFMQASGGDPMKLYEPLKVYLELGQQGPMDAKAVASWVKSDWATTVYPGADSQVERDGLANHLTVLLGDKDLASVWPGRKPPVDGAMVAQARAAIGTLSMGDRAYAVMKQKAMTAGPDWLVADILSQGDAIAFANPDQVLNTRVPYFFTRGGFEKTYTLGLATVQEDLKRDLWVMGSDANTGGMKEEMSNLRPGVAGRYAKDYIAAWENVIKVMQPANYFSNTAAFGAMTKMPSPLKRVLLELRKNTIFAGGVQAGAKRVMRQQLNRSAIGRLSTDFNGGRAMGLDAGEEITNYFEPVHDYVGDEKSPGPIDDFTAAIKEAGPALLAAQSVGGGGGADASQAAMAAAMAKVKALSAGAPPQLQSFTAGAAGGGTSAQVSAVTGAVSDGYKTAVLPACQEVAQEHYPFFGGAAADAATVDVMRVFGAGGVLDSFTQQRLKPLMDVTGPVARWKADDPVAATLDPASPEQFTKASQIRDLLAGGLPLKVSLVKMGSDVGSVVISSGGATYTFTAPGNAAKPIQWTLSGLPEAAVTLNKAGGAAGAAPTQLKTFETEGPWALFKLMDLATKENSGPKAIKVTFGEGNASAVFLVQLPTEQNPFSRGGIWSFRCPSVL